MPRVIKAGLIQAHNVAPEGATIDEIKKANIDNQMKFVAEAARQGVQMLCFQEIFTTPYFCAEQQTHWYEAVERIPDGPTVKMMQEVAKQHGMVLIVPIYEEEQTGIYYNTAAVIDADGRYLGKYRKTHIPHVAPGFWEKFYFRPGNLGYPTFETAFARIGVYICYDRHFPEGARCLGLNGAEIIFNPSATVAGLSEYLWKLEQPAHAVANGYFVGAINRVGTEAPWNIGEFYGQSYFCDPRGQIIAEASRDKDELVVADLDMEKIREVRNTWQFFRDRRPDLAQPARHRRRQAVRVDRRQGGRRRRGPGARRLRLLHRVPRRAVPARHQADRDRRRHARGAPEEHHARPHARVRMDTSMDDRGARSARQDEGAGC